MEKNLSTAHASGLVLSFEDGVDWAAKFLCAALAMIGMYVFGIAGVPPVLPLLAPVLGLSLALPLAIALWLHTMPPRHARFVAELVAVTLVAIGSASFAPATAALVSLVYFVPALLLLHAVDHLS